ncbi:MAG: SpoIIIAH-like family protein [Clostridia bacterium]|nr:SpoIIIAH-like family protein [Clostridia bacterium]
MTSFGKRRTYSCIRAAESVLLLTMLAVCGYAGAQQEAVQSVSVPVVYEVLSAWEISEEAMEDVSVRLGREREREIAMLDSVIANQDASAELVAQALAQKMQLSERMEREARTKAALSYMGYPQVNVICGEDKMTIVAPWQYASDSSERVKLIAAAADEAQLPVECVKIILPKNE